MSSSVGRNSAVIAAGTLASRLTGQIRTILLAAALGTTGIAANAYQAGSTIPQMLYSILSGGIFNAVLVPQIVATLKNKSKSPKEQLDKLITLSLVLLLCVTVVMMACTTLLTDLYLDSSWNNAQRALANSFTLWCMPQIFFYGLYTVLGQVLATQEKFGAYSWSSTGANLISCTGFIIFIAMFGNASQQPLEFWTQGRIALIAGSWTLGVAFQALVLFIPLLKSGYRWSFRLGIHGIGLRSMTTVASWSLGMVIIDQLIGIVRTRISTGAPVQGGDVYGIAGNGTYQNAFTLYILPYSLFAASIATAIFPRLSEYVTDGKLDKVAHEISDAMCNLTLIITFFLVAYLIEPIQITTALIPSIAPAEVRLIRGPLMILTLSTLPAAVFLILQRTFFAFKNGRIPFLSVLLQDLVNTGVMVIGINIFPPKYWVDVVCAGTVAGYLPMIPWILSRVKKKLPHGLENDHIFSTLINTGLAAIAAIVAGCAVTWLFTRCGWDVLAVQSMILRWILAIVQAAIITGVIGGVYYAVLAARHTPELAAVRALVERFASKVPGLRNFVKSPATSGARDDAQATAERSAHEGTEDSVNVDARGNDTQSEDDWYRVLGLKPPAGKSGVGATGAGVPQGAAQGAAQGTASASVDSSISADADASNDVQEASAASAVHMAGAAGDSSMPYSSPLTAGLFDMDGSGMTSGHSLEIPLPPVPPAAASNTTEPETLNAAAAAAPHVTTFTAAAPDAAIPDATVSNTTEPAASDAAMPDATVPNAAKPAEPAAPDAAIPDATVPNAADTSADSSSATVSTIHEPSAEIPMHRVPDSTTAATTPGDDAVPSTYGATPAIHVAVESPHETLSPSASGSTDADVPQQAAVSESSAPLSRFSESADSTDSAASDSDTANDDQQLPPSFPPRAKKHHNRNAHPIIVDNHTDRPHHRDEN